MEARQERGTGDSAHVTTPAAGNRRATGGERLALWTLLAFALLAVAGFGTFGLHLGWLAGFPPWVGRFYGASFSVFAQSQVWLSAGVFLWVLTRLSGRAWVPAFVVLYALSLTAELLGTTYGVPFGAYRYGEALGWRWLERVPVVIPLSWFYMAVPSYALASLLSGRGTGWARAAVASLVLLSWDLSLDPAMSHATRYWFWAESGPYYGMPLLNLAGWYLTGLGLMAGLVWLRAAEWIDRLPLGWVAGFYGVNLLLPVGMNLVAGLGGAVVLAVLVLAAFAAAVGYVRRTGSAPVAAARV